MIPEAGDIFHDRTAHRFTRPEGRPGAEHNLEPARFWSAAKALQWFGYGSASFCLLLILGGGGGILELSCGAAAALLGGAGGVLAERLGPNRLLKGIGVKDVLTPTCLTVPHYTRLPDLAADRSFGGGHCCCAVMRDGALAGVLYGDDLVSLDFWQHPHDPVEWHMHPVDWLEAVDIEDEAAEALEWMKRYRRTFLPVLDGKRLAGIVTRERIVEAARHGP